MIREEEIKKQAEIYTDNRDNYVEWSDGWEAHNDIKFVEKAFIEGAKWADSNPKSSWISVNDDLPCNHEELITTDGHHEKNTICVITINKYGIIEGNHMVLYDNGKWEWKYGVPAPCYWMLIPKLPKESEIDLTVY